MGTKADKAGKLIVIGLVLAGIGLILPEDVTESETVCADGDEYCHPSEDVTVTEEKDNPWKAPLIVGGAIVAIVAFVGYDGPSDGESQYSDRNRLDE